MTTLLTGFSGFVGGHVQAQIPCTPLADETGTPLDILDFNAILTKVRRVRPSQVIHLAAQSFVPASFADPEATYRVNFLGTLNLLTALKEGGFRGRFLFIGSGDTYGMVEPEQLPVVESTPLRPRNPYAVSKVAAEALCYQWSQTGPFKVIMARPFNHIGPGQSDQFAISDFAKQLVEMRLGRRSPELKVGDIDVTRDFTDVRDIVNAYALLLENGANGEIYNVGSGQERSIRSLLITLINLSETNANIATDTARFRPAEQRRMLASSSKLRSATGWTPILSIEQSLKDILEYWTRKLAP